jgi:energy-coupling factor transport system permease protein
MTQVLAEGLNFRHQDTLIHKLDPLLKLLLAVMLLILCFVGSNPFQLLIVGGVIVATAAIAKILRRMGKLVLLSLGFAAFIFIVDFLASVSLMDNVTLTARFLTVMACGSLFFLTTSPDELAQLMTWFKLPRDFVFAFVTAIRFVPVLLMDFRQIVDAQASRGLELKKGNVMRRVRNFGPVLVPIIVNAVMRSNELAEAMESRGYGAVKTPTRMYVRKFTKLDYKAICVIIITIVGIALSFLVLS